MAAATDFFNLGSTVWCRTCHKTEIEGEVMAFDPQNKMLVLKCAASNGDPKLNDVQMVNLSLVSELQVKKEGSNFYEQPQSLNLHRLNTRVRNQVDEKRRMLQAISANVSSEGQSLFLALSKTICGEVRWSNSDIVVWNRDVVINPPYKIENIRGDNNGNEYKYILKLVEKHLADLSINSQNAGVSTGQNNRSSQ